MKKPIHKPLSDKLFCPFCGGEVHIVVTDEEGNLHPEEGYEDDPWSGLEYHLMHSDEDVPSDQICPIAMDGELLGEYGYKTRERAVEIWNSREQV